MDFSVDQRISDTSFFLLDWPLCRLYLKNEARLPWLVLVPRVLDCEEIMDLSLTDQQQLMVEVTKAGQALREGFGPDKINVGALGNIVRQLHIHVIGRQQTDPWWPHSLWQASYQSMPLDEAQYNDWRSKLLDCLDA